MKNKIAKSLAPFLALALITLFTACDTITPPPSTPIPVTPIPSTDPVLPEADQYNVTFTLSGIGKKTVEVSRAFRHAIGNPDSCTESNVTQKYTESLDGIVITKVEGPAVYSQNNDGAAWIENFVVGSPSVVAVYHYNDKGRGFFGDCKGNGWIDASFTLFGSKLEEFTLKAVQESKTLQAGVVGSVMVSYPLEQIVGLNSLNWVYTIEVTAVKGGVTTGSITLTNDEPSSSQFSSSMSSKGQLVLSVK
jgi:hypothetical protein